MARQKKSRKVGPIGVSKGTSKPKTPSSESRKKTPKGNRPGNRNSELLKKTSSGQSKPALDKRVGSKKPIPLVTEDAPNRTETVPKRFKTPQDELQHIENDPVLQQLLDKQEAQQPLSAREQKILDEMLARHQLLCELLGIDDDIDDDDEDHQDL